MQGKHMSAGQKSRAARLLLLVGSAFATGHKWIYKTPSILTERSRSAALSHIVPSPRLASLSSARKPFPAKLSPFGDTKAATHENEMCPLHVRNQAVRSTLCTTNHHAGDAMDPIVVSDSDSEEECDSRRNSILNADASSTTDARPSFKSDPSEHTLTANSATLRTALHTSKAAHRTSIVTRNAALPTSRSAKTSWLKSKSKQEIAELTAEYAMQLERRSALQQQQKRKMEGMQHGNGGREGQQEAIKKVRVDESSMERRFENGGGGGLGSAVPSAGDRPSVERLPRLSSSPSSSPDDTVAAATTTTTTTNNNNNNKQNSKGDDGDEQIELDLIDHTPRAPGARKYVVQRKWAEPGFQCQTLAFASTEIPCFQRGTWLSLCTHRYVVVSPLYPKTDAERRACAAKIKGQLLSLFALDSWPEGLEPEVSFPVIHSTNKDFVDVKFFSPVHHALARSPPTHRFRLGSEPFTPFLHAAFVDASEWLLIQFSHPTINKRFDEPLSRTLKAELLEFGKSALIAIRTNAKNRRLDRLGTPKVLWLLPEGFPHNTEREHTKGWTRIPEYILLLQRHRPPHSTLDSPPPPPPPSHLYIDHPHDAAASPPRWKGWLKVWWNERPPDLCDYCKSCPDNHSNRACPEREKRQDRFQKSEGRIAPVVY